MDLADLSSWPGGFSSWMGFCVEKASDVPSGAAWRARGGRFVPVRHDGMVVGNGEVAAVLGWKSANGAPFISSMSFLDMSSDPRRLAQVLSDDFASERELSEASSAGEAAGRGLVRLLPAQDFVLAEEGGCTFASDFPVCIARRLRKTGIWLTSCERGDRILEIVDVAPLSPLLPLVARIVTVKAKTAIGESRLLCFLKNPALSAADGSVGGSLEATLDGAALVVSAAGGTSCQGLLPGFCVTGSWLQVGVPAMQPGQLATFPFYFAAAGDSLSARAAIEEADRCGAPELVRRTVEGWSEHLTFDFQCGNARLEDLVESIQVLLLSERTRNAGFWAGVCRYPGSYVRDNYYALRGLVATGHYDVSRDHLSGIRDRPASQALTNIYLGRHGTAEDPLTIWNNRNEVPSYAALMLRDYTEYTGDMTLARSMLPRMIDALRGARDQAGLSMSHGDETHHWTTLDFWINDGSIDTSILDLAVLDFLIRMSPEEAGFLSSRRSELLRAIDQAWLGDLRYYPSFVSTNGTKDPRPFLNALLFGFFSGVHRKRSAEGRWCLGAALRLLSMPNGLPMSSVDYPIYSGNAPGLALSAMAETDSPRGDAALAATMDLASATGNYCEYYDVYQHAQYGETMRAIEGGCILTGIVDYLFGIRPLAGGIRVKPHLPVWLGSMALKDFRVTGIRCTIGVERRRLSLGFRPGGGGGPQELLISVEPVCEVEVRWPSAAAPKTRITLRPADEGAPPELEFGVEVGGKGDVAIVPGGFPSLAFEVRIGSGGRIAVRQGMGVDRFFVENVGEEGVRVAGRECAPGDRLWVDVTEPLTLTAFPQDCCGALTRRLFVGEGFRVSGLVRKGRFPWETDVEVTHAGETRKVRSRGGRFEAAFVSPPTAGASVVQVSAGEARASFEVQSLAREALAWKSKVLAGYAPCVVCRPGREGLAQVLAMELSLLLGSHVPIIPCELKSAAMIVRPSCEDPCGEPRDGDLLISGGKGQLAARILAVLDEIRRAWKQVPLLTTDEWQIKSTRYAMLLASRSLGTPYGQVVGSYTSDEPATLSVGGRAPGRPRRKGRFTVRLEDVLERCPTEADLSVFAFDALPRVRQIVVACAGGRNRYAVRLLMPPHLRVVDPTINPRPGLVSWRGAVQSLHVNRDPATLCQSVDVDISVDDGRQEGIALNVISL